MNMRDTYGEKRRIERKRVTFPAQVTDVISGRMIGYAGNLSSNGMLLISTHAPRSEALFQVRLPLPEPGQDSSTSAPIEIGIQEQWHDHAASPGQVWAGYRIVAISDGDEERLHRWLDKN
jgi:hypothetical protein